MKRCYCMQIYSVNMIDYILGDRGADSGAEDEVKTDEKKFDEQKYERKIGLRLTPD